MAARSDRPLALVTGASGFTGRYVLESLAGAGYDAAGLVAPDGSSVDLLDRSALRAALEGRDIDVVIHLAAISFVAHEDVDEIYRVNIIGSRNLLDALATRSSPPRHVILASSANVYGNAGGTINEDTPPLPCNDYAVSKLAMELMARQFESRLPITLVRPFNYTGIGQAERFLIPKIVGHFQRREFRIELGNIDVSRDFNDVRNVAAAYAALAGQSGSFGVYNVCSGVELTLTEVIEMMRDISGHSPEIVINSAFVRANEVARLVGDPARLDALTGALGQFSLYQTLKWMYLDGQ